jgi:hypothetical protein
MEETEVPQIFSLWGGISAVSAALGRDCFIDQGHFTVYPNLYIVLAAGSAKCRKSTIITVVKQLLDAIEPPIHTLSQKSTPEALIGALCGMEAEGESRIISRATGVAVVDEMSTLIDRNSFKSGMIAILTKLYDCGDFDYRTRGRGLEIIREPCLSILGGSTLQWIKEAIPIASIGGGFTARVIFIHQDEPADLIPWPVRSPEMRQLKDSSRTSVVSLSYVAFLPSLTVLFSCIVTSTVHLFRRVRSLLTLIFQVMPVDVM